MDEQHVITYLRERLGMDVQAVKRAPVRSSLGQGLAVWDVMTEHGYFYLVELGDEAEIFRASRSRLQESNGRTCRSPVQAALRFLELHPANGQATEQARIGTEADAITPCANCGAEVGGSRRVALADPPLCRRCRRNQRTQARYRDDPEFRARQLAKHASYRQRRRNLERSSGRPAAQQAGS